MAKKNNTPSIGKAVADLWRSLSSELLTDYRPERHYMRGPGPIWRAKLAHRGLSAEPDLGGMAKASA
jgi:hypothetical protein